MNQQSMVRAVDMIDLENLIPASEACSLLGVSRAGLSKIIAAGKLGVVKTLSNGQIILDRTDVEALVTARAS